MAINKMRIYSMTTGEEGILRVPFNSAVDMVLFLG